MKHQLILICLLITIGTFGTITDSYAQSAGSEGGTYYTCIENEDTIISPIPCSGVELCACSYCNKEVDCEELDWHTENCDSIENDEKDNEDLWDDYFPEIGNGEGSGEGTGSGDGTGGGTGGGGNGNIIIIDPNKPTEPTEPPIIITPEVQPFDFLESHIGDNFYITLHDTFLDRHPEKSTNEIPNYYLSYGNRYYYEFKNDSFKSLLSIEGKEWVDNTAILLQEYIITILNNNPNLETDTIQLYKEVYASHVDAYINGGFFNMSIIDKMNIILLISPEHLLNDYGIEQVLTIGIQQIKYWMDNSAAREKDYRDFINNKEKIIEIVDKYMEYIYPKTRSSLEITTSKDLMNLIWGQQITYWSETIPNFDYRLFNLIE